MVTRPYELCFISFQHAPHGIEIRFETDISHEVEAKIGETTERMMFVKLPSNAHESAAAEISDQILDSVSAITNERASRTLQCRHSPTFEIGDSSKKEPDCSIGPRGIESEAIARDATIVMEIGYKHGTLGKLKAKLTAWGVSESPVLSAIEIKKFRRTLLI